MVLGGPNKGSISSNIIFLFDINFSLFSFLTSFTYLIFLKLKLWKTINQIFRNNLVKMMHTYMSNSSMPQPQILIFSYQALNYW